MTDAADLPTLIARLEASSGADREIDWLIAEHFDVPSKWPSSSVWPPFMDGSKFDNAIPTYTARLDLALDLTEAHCPDGVDPLELVSQAIDDVMAMGRHPDMRQRGGQIARRLLVRLFQARLAAEQAKPVQIVEE